MTHLRSRMIQKWWPTTQSLDLVAGSVEDVAAAASTELHRILGPQSISVTWERFESLDDAFQVARNFTNIPTAFLVLPSQSKWTVLWNNSFLCDGYDTLCSCLTANHGLVTVHWNAHDEDTTTQAGAAFYYRRKTEEGISERFVQAAKEDDRWLFFEAGPPLPQEDIQGYSATRKKDRLNEQRVLRLLADLGATPWDEQFYDIPQVATCVIQRNDIPRAVIRREPGEVLRNRASG